MRFRAGFAAVLLIGLAVPSYAYRMSVWIPPWDRNALTSTQANAGRLDESNPVWYTITADGSVAKLDNAENSSLRAAMTGTDIIPTIQNYINGAWAGQAVADIIATAEGRERHAENLTRLVVQNAYDGIDLDYESVPGTARGDFSTFVALLAEKLHGARKQLSVTVHAKTSDSSTRNGPASQDYRAIGAAADTVKLMVYSYSWGSSAAGPIAPIEWLEKCVAFAASQIPARKIIVGLPWYGYDWLGTRGTSVVYSEAVATAQRNGVAIGHDVNGEATYSYSGRTVYFQDATSYSRKVAAVLAKHPGIGGFAAWRAGAEDPAIWSRVQSLRGGSPTSPALPAPQPPPVVTPQPKPQPQPQPAPPPDGKRRSVRR
jgi:spore germination protein